MIVVDRLVNGIGVDLADAVAVDSCPDVAEQPGQLQLMVGAHAFARDAPFGFRAHDQDGTVLEPGRTQTWGSPAVTDAGAPINRMLPTVESGAVDLGDPSAQRARTSSWTSCMQETIPHRSRRPGHRHARAGVSPDPAADREKDRQGITSSPVLRRFVPGRAKASRTKIHDRQRVVSTSVPT